MLLLLLLLLLLQYTLHVVLKEEFHQQ